MNAKPKVLTEYVPMMMDPKTLRRIERLAAPGQRSEVIRRAIKLGLPVIEKERDEAKN